MFSYRLPERLVTGFFRNIVIASQVYHYVSGSVDKCILLVLILHTLQNQDICANWRETPVVIYVRHNARCSLRGCQDLMIAADKKLLL